MENPTRFGTYQEQRQADLNFHLDRIATAQEKLLAIAEEARAERMKLSEAMRQKFSAGLDK